MTVALCGLLAILEITIGAGVFASANSSIHELLGANLIGFGILTLGLAGLQSDLRKARREAAKERQDALEERQARAAADLKRRSVTISSIDRQQRQTRNTKSTAPRSSRNGDAKEGSVLVRPQSGSAGFRSRSSERHWRLLTSSANSGDVPSPPFNPSRSLFDKSKPRSRSKRK